MTWKFFLAMTFVCLVVQGFFAMLEMACVSFNRVRLQYFVSKNNRRAQWLSFLINHPPLLFGTTLIGVNAALQFGSEYSRRFYESLSLSPDLAPLTQIILVIIFSEIAPILAGRRYAEHVAMMGIPFLYLCSIILRPFIWLLDLLCRGVNRLVRTPATSGHYLSREELQKILEERDPLSQAEGGDFNTIVANIFSLRTKVARELLLPLKQVQMVPAPCTIGQMRQLLKTSYKPYLPIYHRSNENIVAIAYPRDLLRLEENKRVRDFARAPWFITEDSPILEILKQFRRNSQSVAIVLNDRGLATGILTLDAIVDEIFGRSDRWEAFTDMALPRPQIIVDRTFPGDMLLSDFNKQFRVDLALDGAETLEELVTQLLGHSPSRGESVRLQQFEFTVEESPLIGAKQISVTTI
jgi:putative hemolysin